MEDREGDMKVDKTTEQGIGPYRRPAAAPDLAAPGGGGLIAEVYERFPYGIIVVDTGGRKGMYRWPKPKTCTSSV